MQVTHVLGGVSYTPFPFNLLVNLHFNLVSSLLALFAIRIIGNSNENPNDNLNNNSNVTGSVVISLYLKDASYFN